MERVAEMQVRYTGGRLKNIFDYGAPRAGLEISVSDNCKSFII
jgi:hypothetical protein